MFSWTYRLSNYITVVAILMILVALTSIILLTGCNPAGHICENVCDECGKCLDAECTEDACKEKCAGHQVTPPAHTCESKCAECGKCLDDACTEDACKEKCAGHQATPPAHTCESKCAECGRCLDPACTEDACKNKCAGHPVTPPAHACESKCTECGKCLDSACTEDACKEKCAGHPVIPPHTCESVCSECGKCLDDTCTEDACMEKCEGHGSHECESVCAKCGKCRDGACTADACNSKCECKDAGLGESSYISETFTLNLMSFNIRTTASESNPVNNWDNRKPAVVNFINTCGADIIGMQEVRQVQYDYIKANISSNYTVLYFPRESGSNPEGLAFAYDHTKFEFVSSEKYWLSETPETQSKGWGESYYRIAAILILKHIESGELVKSINTHGPLLDVANVNAYELIMERSVKDDDPFVFLCGDFNASPNKLGYVPVAEELQDCRVTADESSSRDYTTFTGWGSYVPGETPGNIIDFCFVSKGDNVDVKSYEVRMDKWGAGNENLLSDHFAVQTTVDITYNSELPEHTDGGFDGAIDPV